jgi:hypothetical protein
VSTIATQLDCEFQQPSRGGKAESLQVRAGRMEIQMAEDQLAQDKSVRALLKNHIEKRPLVLLADDRYKPFPYNLAASGYTYIVLGFYYVKHAWGETFWYLRE